MHVFDSWSNKVFRDRDTIVKQFRSVDGYNREVEAFRTVNFGKAIPFTADEATRSIVFYDDGSMRPSPTRETIVRMGARLREHHYADNVTHGDVCVTNTLVDTAGHLRFIDWEDMGLLTRHEDLALAAVNIGCGVSPTALKWLFRGYGRTPRPEKVHAMLVRDIMWAVQHRPQTASWYDPGEEVVDMVKRLRR